MTDPSARYPGLRNRGVLITGGASGIGASAVRQFAKQGARVAFLDIQDEAAQKLVSEISLTVALSPIYVHCDLVDISALQKAISDLQAGLGHIINLSSIGWLISSVKAAIVGLTRTMAHELGQWNIRVNAVLPGAILTDRQRELWWTPEYQAEIMRSQCLKRPLLP